MFENLERIVRKLALGARNIALGASLAVMLYACDGCISKKQEPIVKENSLTAKLGNEKPADKEANAELLKEIKDLGRIYFVSDRDGQWDIYSMKPDGSDVKRVTNTHERESHPVVSHNGKYLAFDDCRHIYVLDMHNGKIRPLTHDILHDSDPCWSFDDKTIFFGRVFLFHSEVYVTAADGNSNPKSLTERVLTEEGAMLSAWSPTASPDGKKIAFVGSIIDEVAQSVSDISSIYIMNINGTGLKRISSGGHAADPSWSPAGNRIAYMAYHDVKENINVGDIFIAKLNESDTLNLTKYLNGDLSAFSPDWSPLADYLAFTQSKTKEEVSLFTADGKLSPDISTKQDYEICIIRAKGGSVVSITDGPSIDKEPSFGIK